MVAGHMKEGFRHLSRQMVFLGLGVHKNWEWVGKELLWLAYRLSVFQLYFLCIRQMPCGPFTGAVCQGFMAVPLQRRGPQGFVGLFVLSGYWEAPWEKVVVDYTASCQLRVAQPCCWSLGWNQVDRRYPGLDCISHSTEHRSYTAPSLIRRMTDHILLPISVLPIASM